MPELRKQCNGTRIILTRAMANIRISEEAKEQLRAAYKEKRKALSKMIESAKERCWKDLIEELDTDIRGSAYRIVRKKFRRDHRGGKTDEETLAEARKRFPSRNKIRWGII